MPSRKAGNGVGVAGRKRGNPQEGEETMVDSTASETKTCPCGHDRDHYMVSADGKYTNIGTITMLIGITTKPVSVSYRCRQCQTVFDFSDDPAVLAKIR